MSILGWTVWTLPPYSDQMRELVFSKLGISGVENPVTAVLLNFRSYDTLLEIGVLLLAALSVLSIGPLTVSPTGSATSQFQILLLRLLLPFFTLVGGYILWTGKSAPGGAFQAGAILAAGGILLVTSASRLNQSAINCIPLALIIGLQTFLLVALATMMLRGNFLQYPVNQAGILILVIEAAAAISIAVALILMFIGGKPNPNPETQTENGRLQLLRKEKKIK
jgi:multisubunit Na+/H+ antiporter MnhB subunit